VPLVENPEFVKPDGAGVGHALQGIGADRSRVDRTVLHGLDHGIMGIAVLQRGKEAEGIDAETFQFTPADQPAAEGARLDRHEPAVAQILDFLDFMAVGPGKDDAAEDGCLLPRQIPVDQGGDPVHPVQFFQFHVESGIGEDEIDLRLPDGIVDLGEIERNEVETMAGNRAVR